MSDLPGSDPLSCLDYANAYKKHADAGGGLITISFDIIRSTADFAAVVGVCQNEVAC